MVGYNIFNNQDGTIKPFPFLRPSCEKFINTMIFHDVIVFFVLGLYGTAYLLEINFWIAQFCNNIPILAVGILLVALAVFILINIWLLAIVYYPTPIIATRWIIQIFCQLLSFYFLILTITFDVDVDDGSSIDLLGFSEKAQNNQYEILKINSNQQIIFYFNISQITYPISIIGLLYFSWYIYAYFLIVKSIRFLGDKKTQDKYEQEALARQNAQIKKTQVMPLPSIQEAKGSSDLGSIQSNEDLLNINNSPTKNTQRVGTFNYKPDIPDSHTKVQPQSINNIGNTLQETKTIYLTKLNSNKDNTQTLNRRTSKRFSILKVKD